MASKSSVSVYMDDGATTSVTYESDASGYAMLQMSDGKNTVTMKLDSTNSHTLRTAMNYADALRALIPTS